VMEGRSQLLQFDDGQVTIQQTFRQKAQAIPVNACRSIAI